MRSRHDCICVEQVGDDASALVLQLDREGRIVRFNAAFETLCGHELRDVQGHDWFETFVPPPDRARARRRFGGDATGDLAHGRVVPLRTRDQGDRAVRWHATWLGDPSANDGLLALGDDVTDQVEAYEALRASDERWRRIAAYVDDVLWVVDLHDPRDSYLSPAVETTYGLSVERLKEDPASFFALVHEDDRPALRAAIAAAQNGAWGGHAELRLSLPDGSARWIRSRFKVVADARGERTHVVGTATDVTRAKSSERQALDALGSLEQRFAARTAELDAAQARLRDIVDRLPGIVFVCTPDGAITEASRSARTLATGHLAELVTRTGPSDSITALRDAIASASEGDTVRHRIAAHATERAGVRLELVYEPIRDRSGGVSQILVLASERISGVSSSAPPRPTPEPIPLVREIQERVKNDLQMISSLLFLEARRSGDPKAAAALQSSRNRIRVLAMAHEHCDAQAHAQVDLGAYLRAITVALRVGYGDQGGRVRVEETLAACVVGLDVAVPCGLVASELVTNALEHAFPGERSGTIVVSLTYASPHGYELRVEDDGAGPPPRTRGLGLELCERLAGQLGTTLESTAGPGGAGTSSAIRFRA